MGFGGPSLGFLPRADQTDSTHAWSCCRRNRGFRKEREDSCYATNPGTTFAGKSDIEHLFQQALNALIAAIYLSVMGKEGFEMWDTSLYKRPTT